MSISEIKWIVLFASLVTMPAAFATTITFESTGSIGRNAVVDNAGLFGQVGRVLPGGAATTESFTFEIDSLMTSVNEVNAYGDSGTYTLSVGDLSYKSAFHAEQGGFAVTLIKDFEKFVNGRLYATYDEMYLNGGLKIGDGKFGVTVISQSVGARNSIGPAMDFSDTYTFAAGGTNWQYICLYGGGCTDLHTSSGFASVSHVDLRGPGRNLGGDPPPSAVPEPSSMALLALGLLSLVGVKRWGQARRRTAD